MTPFQIRINTSFKVTFMEPFCSNWPFWKWLTVHFRLILLIRDFSNKKRWWEDSDWSNSCSDIRLLRCLTQAAETMMMVYLNSLCLHLILDFERVALRVWEGVVNCLLKWGWISSKLQSVVARNIIVLPFVLWEFCTRIPAVGIADC